MTNRNAKIFAKPGDKVMYTIDLDEKQLVGEGIVLAHDFEHEFFYVKVTYGDVEYEADDEIPFDHVLVYTTFGDSYHITETGE